MINVRTPEWSLGPSKALYSSEIATAVPFRSHASSSGAETSPSKFMTNLSYLTSFVASSSIMLYAANDPVIEASSNLKFGPFNLSYPKLGEQAAAAELNPNENKWELVFDFTDTGSPNYRVIPPAEWKTESLNLPDSDA